MFRHVEVPHGVEMAPHEIPWAGVEEQVVALHDDEARGGCNQPTAGSHRFPAAVKHWPQSVDPGVKSAEMVDETRSVKRTGYTLESEQTEFGERFIVAVEAVHWGNARLEARRRDRNGACRQAALSSAGWPRDAQDEPLG